AKPNPYSLEGPDLATARALAQGHLPDHAVTLVINPGRATQGLADEVKRELAAIGLDVAVGLNVGPCCPHYDLSFGYWFAEEPDPLRLFRSPLTEGVGAGLAPPWQARITQAERLYG